MALDAMQVLKLVYDETKEALRVTGVLGSLDAQITWAAGLGAMTHILGPTDQDLKISSYDDNEIILAVDDDAVMTLDATKASVTSGNAGPYNLNAIAAGADTTLTVKMDGGGVQTVTFSALNPTIIANGGYAALTKAGAALVIDAALAAGLTVTAPAGGVKLERDVAGVGRSVQVTGGTANDPVNGFNYATSVVTGTSPVTLPGSLSVTGAATVGSLTTAGTVQAEHLYSTDDAIIDDQLTVTGLLLSSGPRRIKTLLSQAGAANVITVAATDHYIGVDCSGAAKAVNLPAAATAGVGRVLYIKDETGDSGANPITITPNGAEKIDEAATFVINSAHGSVTLVCTGVAGNEWAVV